MATAAAARVVVATAAEARAAARAVAGSVVGLEVEAMVCEHTQSQ